MLKRRKFIEGITALGVVAMAGPLASCGQEEVQISEAVSQGDNNTVYRLQTRKTRSSNACRKHQRYKVFLDHAAADNNRAHPGCNCRIVTQQVTEEYLTEITPFALDGVIELRYVFGYVPA